MHRFRWFMIGVIYASVVNGIWFAFLQHLKIIRVENDPSVIGKNLNDATRDFFDFYESLKRGI